MITIDTEREVVMRWSSRKGETMPDDKTKRGDPDRDRISVDEPWEIASWAKILGVSEQQIRDCVKRVGPMVADVKKCLEK